MANRLSHQLLDRTLLGMADADRFRRLFENHRTAVFRFALRRGTPDLAEEVLAETFLVAWRRLDDVPAGAELPWLLTTARLVLMNLTRAARRRDQLANRIDLPLSEPDHAPGVARSLDVHRALARLRDSDQEVLRLIEWDGLSQADAAIALGCSRAAFAVRLRRARARFMKALGTDPPAAASSRSPDAEWPSQPRVSRRMDISTRSQWIADEPKSLSDVRTGRSIL
jgi:RNA polymerase sigma-70 factor (ECF subfamily)